MESGVWYTSAVAWAADQEIVKGVSEEAFAPNRYITREQLAAILYRYAGEPEAKGNLAAYPDAGKVSEYALDAMKCTRVVIAHRLSTIRQCDRIIVLENGRIVEDGGYDELIAKDGYFAELVARQRLDKET